MRFEPNELTRSQAALGEGKTRTMLANLKLLLALNDIATVLPKAEVQFRDGSSLQPSHSEANVARFVKENDGWAQVPGWLIIGGCIFIKHWAAIDLSRRTVEITPFADGLPFAKHYPRIGNYASMSKEIFLLQSEQPA